MLFIVLALVTVAALAVWQYNKLVRLNVTVDEAFAQIEVQLKRRADLIPNLIATVKGYAAHESATFEKVVTARAAATSAQGLPAVAQADAQLTTALRGLLAVAEAYPDLKASTNFLALQEELSTTENKVAFARQFYNDSVRTLNVVVKAIPGMWFASIAKVAAREFYEIENPTDRNVPTVSF